MIFISCQQFEAIEKAFHKRRDEQLVAEVARWFPRRVAEVDRQVLAEFVGAACARARAAGYGGLQELVGWSVLSLLCGAEWDSDPQLVWAAPALAAPSAAGDSRIAAVLAAGLGWRSRVMGPDDEFLLAALDRFCATTPDLLLTQASRSLADLLVQFGALYPEKRGTLSDAVCTDLLNRAIADARDLGLLDRRGVVYVVMLMLLLGAGALRDPLYASLATALRNASQSAVIDRLAAAHEVARALIRKQFFQGAASIRLRAPGALLCVPPGGLPAGSAGAGTATGIVARPSA